MTDRIRELNGPPLIYVEADACDPTLPPDDRETCGHCARTSGQGPRDDKKCPRLPKYPSEFNHRCWYFLPQKHLEDQRPGHERYATNDLQQRAYFGWRP